MYAIYWSLRGRLRLWHPLSGFYRSDKESAERGARALSKVYDDLDWAYGPLHEDGLKQVN